ncbi:hypothetical protein [Brevibacillus sp. SYSU BS000544]|uniref:hypothetical protein n=1 Tax=Brevibacillus sp. SYSU BS000544 TaxID=3416443 RepID=UPI003CE45524
MIVVGSTPEYKIKYFNTLMFDQYSDFLQCFITSKNDQILFKEYRQNFDCSWIDNMDWDNQTQEEVRNNEKEWEKFVSERVIYTPEKWYHPFYNVTTENVIFFSPKEITEMQQILKKKHGLVNDTCIVVEQGRKLEEWKYILTFVEHVWDGNNEEDEYWAVFVNERIPNQFTINTLPVLMSKGFLTEY